MPDVEVGTAPLEGQAWQKGDSQTSLDHGKYRRGVGGNATHVGTAKLALEQRRRLGVCDEQLVNQGLDGYRPRFREMAWRGDNHQLVPLELA